MSATPTSSPLRQLQYGAVMLGVLAALAGPTVGHAQAAAAAAAQSVPKVQRYELPAAPAIDTLRAIAQRSGANLQFEADTVAGRNAKAVSGDFTVTQALAAALADSGLVAVERGGVVWVTTPAKLDQVVVVAKRDQAETSFKADRSDTATRSGSNLSEVPQSVTIITSKVLETQQALSVRDALANVSGMAFTQSPQGSPSFQVRGFFTPASTVNGVSDTSASLTNVFGVERIEVLKGPQAILAGANSLGGGVNVVTKKPQAETIRSLLLQYGSHGDKTIAGDVGGALTDDKKLSFRLIAVKTDADSNQAGFNGREETSVLPQLRWKDETTDLIVGYSYGKQHQPTPLYTFARRDGVILPTPAIRQGAPDDGFDTEQKRAFYQLEQRLTPAVTLVSRLQRAETDLSLHVRSPGGLTYATGASTSSPNATIRYSGGRSTQATTETSGDHYLRIEGSTGPLTHKLSVGVNHSDYDYQQRIWDGAAVTASVYPVGAAVTFPDVLTASGQTLSSVTDQTTTQFGTYVQDLVSWGDWTLLANLRRNRYTTVSATNYVTINYLWANPKTKVWSTNPGVGLIYNVTPDTAVYASYGEGFQPQSNTACGGGLVDPITTRNRELGAKFDLLGGKLALTTAAFELAQSNTLAYDSVNNCYNVRDSQVTRGLELDVQGQLAPGWNAILNYTYTTLKDVGNKATVYYAQAKHKASLWTTYQLPTDPNAPQWWQGVGVGLGVSAASHVNGTGNATYPFRIPGQAQLDASLFYNRDKWNVTFGVKNLADRTLYGVSGSNSYIPVFEGRNYMLTVRRDFN